MKRRCTKANIHGGRVLAHYSSIRLELTRTMAQKNGDNIVGLGIKGTVVKGLVGASFRVAEWKSIGRRLDREFGLVEQGVGRGVISNETTALKFRGEHLGADRNAAREFLLQHPDLAALLETQLGATMKCMAGAGRYYDSQSMVAFSEVAWRMCEPADDFKRYQSQRQCLFAIFCKLWCLIGIPRCLSPLRDETGHGLRRRVMYSDSRGVQHNEISSSII